MKRRHCIDRGTLLEKPVPEPEPESVVEPEPIPELEGVDDKNDEGDWGFSSIWGGGKKNKEGNNTERETLLVLVLLLLLLLLRPEPLTIGAAVQELYACEEADTEGEDEQSMSLWNKKKKDPKKGAA
jgi:hypothetical protein